MRDILEFDDAGADDDQPAKGVTIGDIRAWFDDRERMRAALQACGSDWISATGTVASTASMLSQEFMRRMNIAHAALTTHESQKP